MTPTCASTDRRAHDGDFRNVSKQVLASFTPTWLMLAAWAILLRAAAFFLWPNIGKPEWGRNCSEHLDPRCFVLFWCQVTRAKGNGPLLAPSLVVFWAMDSPVRKHGDIAVAETTSVQSRQGRLNSPRRGHNNHAWPLQTAMFTSLFLHIATSLSRFVSAATISRMRKSFRPLPFHIFKQCCRRPPPALGTKMSAKAKQHNFEASGSANSSSVLLQSASRPIPPSSACRVPRWALALSQHHMTTSCW
ncbi:hypothetical protein B0T18DRAFT_169939 [Schizothecium vesticola]|uniref:Uncharacterized protein n=1 Tax=Schizothecium vesticola TaxID=314040 RepID=A0AA40ENV6_9PEZI|nr:hypothetical protein B0T18DRAFT_169939 [Schizothecium vesticola]